ncbi:MAG: hypothetical protein JSS66_03070 [Armatimonadetes bacterium]|nr:hypothetical protein [Armatimonadota bacterium]
MSTALHSFLSRVTPRSSQDLIEAFLRLPEDKRNWSPMGEARTALDQVAEVAILNGSTADLLRTRQFDGEKAMETFMEAKAALVNQGWDAVRSLLESNTEKFVGAINEVSEADMGVEIQMPWGPMTLEQIMSYPFWNACYHEGQINYIATMIGAF